MLSKPLLALLLAVAPSGAWALDDLDCIGIESCQQGVCTPSDRTFSIDFNWADQTAVTALDGVPETLSIEGDSAAPVYTSGNVFLLGADGPTATVLILRFSSTGITTTSSTEPNAPHHYAECAPQEAT